MSILAEAITAAEIADGRPCSLPGFLGSLPPELHADVEAAIYNGDISASVLSRALDGLGHPLSVDIIRRHRRGECRSCRRP